MFAVSRYTQAATLPLGDRRTTHTIKSFDSVSEELSAVGSVHYKWLITVCACKRPPPSLHAGEQRQETPRSSPQVQATHTSLRAEPSPRCSGNHHWLLTVKFLVSVGATCER